MTDAAVATDFYQALDVQRDFTAQVAFDLDVMLDVLAQFVDLLLEEVEQKLAGLGLTLRAAEE